jgi:hypothetical protein
LPFSHDFLEVDFLVTENAQPLFIVEAKVSDVAVSSIAVALSVAENTGFENCVI